jgi:chaperonin cofactor prefoldin
METASYSHDSRTPDQGSFNTVFPLGHPVGLTPHHVRIHSMTSHDSSMLDSELTIMPTCNPLNPCYAEWPSLPEHIPGESHSMLQSQADSSPMTAFCDATNGTGTPIAMESPLPGWLPDPTLDDPAEEFSEELFYPSFTEISSAESTSTPPASQSHSDPMESDWESQPHQLTPPSEDSNHSHFESHRPTEALPVICDPSHSSRIPELIEGPPLLAVAAAAEANNYPCGRSSTRSSSSRTSPSMGSRAASTDQIITLMQHRLNHLMDHYETQLIELTHSYHAQLGHFMHDRDQMEVHLMELQYQLDTLEIKESGLASSSKGSSPDGRFSNSQKMVTSFGCQTNLENGGASATSPSEQSESSSKRVSFHQVDLLHQIETLELKCQTLQQSNTQLASHLAELQSKRNAPRPVSTQERLKPKESDFIQQALADVEDMVRDLDRGVRCISWIFFIQPDEANAQGNQGPTEDMVNLLRRTLHDLEQIMDRAYHVLFYF